MPSFIHDGDDEPIQRMENVLWRWRNTQLPITDANATLCWQWAKLV
jgi:hypothetical protein